MTPSKIEVVGIPAQSASTYDREFFWDEHDNKYYVAPWPPEKDDLNHFVWRSVCEFTPVSSGWIICPKEGYAFLIPRILLNRFSPELHKFELGLYGDATPQEFLDMAFL